MKITIEPEGDEDITPHTLENIKEMVFVGLEGVTMNEGRVYTHPHSVVYGDTCTLIGHLSATIERLRDGSNPTN